MILKWILSTCVCLIFVTTSTWVPTNQVEFLRRFTRPFEFDYFGWTLRAAGSKGALQSLGIVHHLNDNQQRKIINDYFKIQSNINQINEEIEAIYADPEITNPDEGSLQLRTKLDQLTEWQQGQAILAEAVLQDQISQVLHDMDLTELGLPFPPVLYHVTQLPRELVVSPRDAIRQEASVSLSDTITIDEIELLEQDVEENTDFSALVVTVGGIGTYPTMVISSTDLARLIETVAHEWIHNALIFKPLGIRYDLSAELRTMNETTASIAGKEISRAVMQRYYAIERTKQYPLYDTVMIGIFQNEDNPDQPFDFQKEMYQTRLKVDELLGEEKIDEAEQYMEDRRALFWENGYRIRKLNQAYFAFHGAYADKSFSAAGDDPVGADVRLLRKRSGSLSQFYRRISRMTSYDDLKDFLDSY